jgi:hypothetical protein
VTNWVFWVYDVLVVLPYLSIFPDFNISCLGVFNNRPCVVVSRMVFLSKIGSSLVLDFLLVVHGFRSNRCF